MEIANKRNRDNAFSISVFPYTELRVTQENVILYLQDSKYKDRISDYFYYVASITKRNDLYIKFDYCRTETNAMWKIRQRRKKG